MSSPSRVARPAQAPTPGTESSARAGWRGWLALAALMLPVLLVSIDNTVLTFALPSITEQLRPDGTALLWIVDIYPLVLAGLLVAMGSTADRVGRRRLLFIGSTGFLVVSAVAAFSPNATALIAVRAALGFFGAMLMPSTMSLLRAIFTDPHQHRLAIAVWSATFATGAAIGPVVGGVLLEHCSWGSIFLAGVPVLLLFLLVAPFVVPESRDPHPGPVDPVSIVLSLAALAPLVFAIKTVAESGVTDVALASLGLAVLSGIAFVRRQLRRPLPMLDLTLFRSGTFSGAVTANLLSIFAVVGFLFFVSQHLQLVLGQSPLQAAVALLPGAVASVLAGLAIVPLVRRVPVRYAMAGGFLLSAAGYGLVVLVADDPTAAALAAAFVLLSAGIGAAETLSNDAVLTAAPTDKAGAAAAINETAYELGAVLGTAVLGSILTASYRSHLQVPAGLTPEQAHAATETLGGATGVAAGLPAGQAAQLLDSARHAFDSGVVVTAGLGALVTTAAAVLVVLALRPPRGIRTEA
ncbi:MFS transporter [Nakamurella leprariae]|uniref:MFS transporter n=1 Tax=Nakamurella leprariae TaxID=2803911 RepID=A0A939C2C7_9ACTN|nr:MFS transporter [Nakamurella leprariae]MBM9467982.1 MFS transporter [Nakamurella leprariae]